MTVDKHIYKRTLQSVEPGDTPFWEQFWSPNNVASAQDIFSLIPSSEIRALREDAPNNLATLCYKTVERLVDACDHACTQPNEHKIGSFMVIDWPAVIEINCSNQLRSLADEIVAVHFRRCGLARLFLVNNNHYHSVIMLQAGLHCQPIAQQRTTIESERQMNH